MNTESKTRRIALRRDHFERIFRTSDFSKEIGGRVEEVCSLLYDCFPSGNQRDAVGATFKQVAYVLTLADLNEDEAKEFLDVITSSGGMSSQQAHHLINKLKA